MRSQPSRQFFYSTIIVFSMFGGCEQSPVDQQSVTTATLAPETKGIEFSEALSMAYDKFEQLAEKKIDNFDLKVRRGEGEWRFSFFVIPESPGGHPYIIVSEKGEVEVLPGL